MSVSLSFLYISAIFHRNWHDDPLDGIDRAYSHQSPMLLENCCAPPTAVSYSFLVPLALIILKISKLLPHGGLVPSGAYIARPLLSAWLYILPP